MLELYQFEISHYCEKIRLILDYKQLPYRTIEVTPGLGQVDLYRLSGQRQVPVLKDGSDVVSDSTAIARFLGARYPERPILPLEPQPRGLGLMMEAWADDSIGLNARKAMIGAFNQHPNFRKALLPDTTPSPLKDLVGVIPGDLLNVLGSGVGLGPTEIKLANEALRQDLEALCLLLETQPYLLGEQPTLADFAVAGVSMYIKFPASRYVALPQGLCDQGIPGLADDPAYRPFFAWRDRLYADYRQPRQDATTSQANGGPTSIDIE